MKIHLIEFLGGPYDGAHLPVAEGTESIVIREGAAIHRYDVGEVYEGPKVRRVFRETQVIALPPGASE